MSTSPELQAMTVKELYALAKAHDIAGRSRMRKAELVDALEGCESYQQTLEPAETDAKRPTTPVCPQCDSDQIWIGHFPGLAMAGGWVPGGPFVRCEACGKTTHGERPKRIAAPAEPEPAELPELKALAEDMTVPAGMFDPELTYYADGTRVVMRARGEERHGVAVGMAAGSPYQFQAVRFDDGTTTTVAPHVLSPEPAETTSYPRPVSLRNDAATVAAREEVRALGAPALTRERAEELVLAAEAANDWWDATDRDILDDIVPANVAADSIDTATRPDVAAAYRIVIGAAEPTPADEGGELAGGPAYVYCRSCALESIASGVPYCADCVPEPEYTVTVPKHYTNAPDESEITIGITALGGGTVGEAYAGTGWQWQVRENSTLVLLAQDLRSNMTPATHDDMARTLAAFLSADAETLAYGDRDALSTEYTQAQRAFIDSNGERLSAFAHDPFNH